MLKNMAHLPTQLREKVSTISEFIENKNDCIYVDYPFYFNVGDLLIFHGTLEFFKDKGINIKASYSVANSSIKKIKKKVTPETTIFLQGGGNFGDLYPVHQKLRESIIKHFPNNKIIMLPQSVHFDSEEEMLKSQHIFEQHKNLILFARDEISFQLLKKFSDHTYLMPDMAHYLYGILDKKGSSRSGEDLFFLRKDKEKISLPNTLDLSNKLIVDWDDVLVKKDHKKYKKIQKLYKNQERLPFIPFDGYAFKKWEKCSKELIHRACELFSKHDRIVTSRLHAHILASLLEIPSIILDNSYKKNSLYYRAWTQDIEIHKLYEES